MFNDKHLIAKLLMMNAVRAMLSFGFLAINQSL